ncbi:flagellin [Mobiluncus mulieris]|uniref:flagellin N-terminal helical domain-containing protein n=1 Tax=Mobiluncus mulieris TaxID=2052 RepID=UPI001B8D91A1|nr:flagellin [Mobiluncus mulieris]
MSLSINQNIMAMNSYRNLSVTQGGLAKSLEKLSSGFRINRAADDAAGLAISEGLRSQVGGNRQAVRNAQDGISVIQTAEGALNEVHSILQRMRVLAVQGANDSNDSKSRNNIKAELVQLRDELKRVGEVTNFNGTKLLNGKASGNNAMKFQVGANGTVSDRIVVDFKDADVTAISDFDKSSKDGKIMSVKTAALKGASGTKGTLETYAMEWEGKQISFKLDNGEILSAEKLGQALKGTGIGYIGGGGNELKGEQLAGLNAAAFKDQTISLTIGEHKVSLTDKDGLEGIADVKTIADKLNQRLAKEKLSDDYELKVDGAAGFKLVAKSDKAKNDQVDVKLETTASGITINTKPATTLLSGKVGKAHGPGYEFSVSATGEITAKRSDGKAVDPALSHSIVKINTANPGTGDTAIALTAHASEDGSGAALDADKYFGDTAKITDQLSVETHDEAQNLIAVLDNKINSVSTARANLGAIQNRFEHTITNLNVAVENLAASESRIRDTDMAQEMMQFTRNQILSQAGTSMLAQANQVPQGVLSLLR